MKTYINTLLNVNCGLLEDLTIPKKFPYLAEMHFEHFEMINSCHYILLILLNDKNVWYLLQLYYMLLELKKIVW